MPVTDESLNASIRARARYYAKQIEAAGDFVGPNDMSLSNKLWSVANELLAFSENAGIRRIEPVQFPPLRENAVNDPFYIGNRIRVVSSPFQEAANGDEYTIVDLSMSQTQLQFVITDGPVGVEDRLYFYPNEIEPIS